MNVCVFGKDGVGKSFLKTTMATEMVGVVVHEINQFKQDPDRARAFLKRLQSFCVVFVITTEGGRLQSDDVELLHLFQSYADCLVIVNKTEYTSPELISRIQSIFAANAAKVAYLPLFPNKTDVLNCVTYMKQLSPQRYKPFMWPYEELQQLQKKAVEAKKQQEDELRKVESEKQRLLKEKETLHQQLVAAEQQLRDQEKAKQMAIALAYARVAERQKIEQQQNQRRQQEAFAAQQAQEAQRQRQRDDAFRAQIARAGR
jgi:flagellar biosynthesis GTPase FlhF